MNNTWSYLRVDGSKDPLSSSRCQSARALSVESLREAVPNEYRTWVRSAVIVCVCAYAATTLATGIEDGFGRIHSRQELYALVLSLVGLLVERRGKAMVAAYWVLLVASVEACASFYLSADGLRAAALPALPVIVLASGLFLGPRAAYGFAFATSVAVPSLVWISGRFGPGPGLGEHQLVSISALFASQLATAVVLHVFLRSFGSVLATAKLSQRRTADLLEAASDGLVVLTPEGRIEATNESASFHLGMTRDELARLDVGELPLAPVERQSGRFVLSELTGEEGSREYRALNTDVALEVRAKRVASGDKRGAWLLLLRDITARLEAQRREAELARQLQNSQKLEAIGQLAGGVAHDFNNLLTVVAGYSDFIEDLSDERAPEIAEELRATYGRGVVLTRQLLAFARREIIAPIPLDVAQVATGLRNLLGRMMGDGVDVVLVADREAVIDADPGQVEQVIMNLAANARDAMPGGGNLYIRVLRTDEHVVLEMEDTGSGIDETTRARMFEPFFTTKPRGKGAGLGLSTAWGIVSQSGGRIVVDSRLGEGTSFRIAWPRTEKPTHEQSRTSYTSRPPRGGGLILLAEDDEHARRMIRRMLTDAGFEVLVAESGAEALALLTSAESAPDLLLTDIVMPGMSGVQLLEEVQRIHPTISYLLMSGYTDRQIAPDRQDLRRALLQKPFARAELLERLDAVLPQRLRMRA